MQRESEPRGGQRRGEWRKQRNTLAGTSPSAELFLSDSTDSFPDWPIPKSQPTTLVVPGDRVSLKRQGNDFNAQLAPFEMTGESSLGQVNSHHSPVTTHFSCLTLFRACLLSCSLAVCLSLSIYLFLFRSLSLSLFLSFFLSFVRSFVLSSFLSFFLCLFLSHPPTRLCVFLVRCPIPLPLLHRIRAKPLPLVLPSPMPSAQFTSIINATVVPSDLLLLLLLVLPLLLPPPLPRRFLLIPITLTITLRMEVLGR